MGLTQKPICTGTLTVCCLRRVCLVVFTEQPGSSLRVAGGIGNVRNLLLHHCLLVWVHVHIAHAVRGFRYFDSVLLFLGLMRVSCQSVGRIVYSVFEEFSIFAIHVFLRCIP